MKIYNVTLTQWDEQQKDFVEFQRQYLGETENEAIEEASKKNPTAAALYANEIGEADLV